MPKYRVNFYYEEQGHVIVHADNEDDAREAVSRELEENGVEDIYKDSTYDEMHREYGVNDIEDVTNE